MSVDTRELTIADLNATIVDMADAIADLEGKIDDVLSIMEHVGASLKAAAAHPMLGQFLGGKPF